MIIYPRNAFQNGSSPSSLVSVLGNGKQGVENVEKLELLTCP
jgi:hypothetical protein